MLLFVLSIGCGGINFMDYQKLSKLYYMDESEYEREYEKR